VNLLLDTHVFLWWDRADKALNAEARALIAELANQVFISAASVVGQFEGRPPTQGSGSRIAGPDARIRKGLSDALDACRPRTARRVRMAGVQSVR
jgi:hypothetical protein